MEGFPEFGTVLNMHLGRDGIIVPSDCIELHVKSLTPCEHPESLSTGNMIHLLLSRNQASIEHSPAGPGLAEIAPLCLCGDKSNKILPAYGI